jgi:hypothetical protein
VLIQHLDFDHSGSPDTPQEIASIDCRVITLIGNLVGKASPGIDLYSSFGFNADMKYYPAGQVPSRRKSKQVTGGSVQRGSRYMRGTVQTSD